LDGSSANNSCIVANFVNLQCCTSGTKETWGFSHHSGTYPLCILLCDCILLLSGPTRIKDRK
jgi:hypothetical protein